MQSGLVGPTTTSTRWANYPEFYVAIVGQKLQVLYQVCTHGGTRFVHTVALDPRTQELGPGTGGTRVGL
eukprot:125269-Rhodomonas_salina.1